MTNFADAQDAELKCEERFPSFGLRLRPLTTSEPTLLLSSSVIFRRFFNLSHCLLPFGACEWGRFLVFASNCGSALTTPRELLKLFI